MQKLYFPIFSDSEVPVTLFLPCCRFRTPRCQKESVFYTVFRGLNAKPLLFTMFSESEMPEAIFSIFSGGSGDSQEKIKFIEKIGF